MKVFFDIDSFAIMNIPSSLLQKYNVPVPRYTSYPTVPFWKESIDEWDWKKIFSLQFALNNARDGISLYLHLPFCESLCTYCGCNKKITGNHGVEKEYMAAIEKEWQLYLQLMNEAPVIRELHLGGGTPTFFSPAHLVQLLENIFAKSKIHPLHEFNQVRVRIKQAVLLDGDVPPANAASATKLTDIGSHVSIKHLLHGRDDAAGVLHFANPDVCQNRIRLIDHFF